MALATSQSLVGAHGATRLDFTAINAVSSDLSA
jgi:hypothetical protein